MLAMPARAIQPRDSNCIALLDVRNALADLDDIAHALMSGDKAAAGQRLEIGLDRPIALDCVQIGVANAACFDFDQNLTISGFGNRDFFNH